MAYLEAHNVVKRYANHLALDDVSINIEQGSVFGLLGPNGAGKSTLIRIINRIIMLDEGEIRLNGKLMKNKDIARIGYLPEERGLYRKMKVGDQAIYLARLKGIDKKVAEERLHQWFEKFEIETWWNRKVEELSKGMQQKIQFICTVIHEPELLIFDEPFSGFDPVNANLLKKEMLELRDKGATIIFSTHNMQSVEEVCTEMSLINKSKVVLNGNVNEVKHQFYDGSMSLLLAHAEKANEWQLPNIAIDSVTQEGDNTRLMLRHLAEQADVKAIIQALPASCDLIEIKQMLPSMNDIFIQTVGESTVNNE